VSVIDQNYEQGWRSLSLYTGASVVALQRAAEAGEFSSTGPSAWPLVAHAELDAWLMRRSFGPQILDDLVKLAADLEQAS
jgi:hypothetical protein